MMCEINLIILGPMLSGPGDLPFFKLHISLVNSSFVTGSQYILFIIDIW